MADQESKLKIGPPIWVESLMNLGEWKQRYKMYPTSTRKEPPSFFISDYEWRWRMGDSLTPEQIRKFNDTEKLKEIVVKLQELDEERARKQTMS